MNKQTDKKRKDPVIIVLDIIIVGLIFVMIYVGMNALFYMERADKRSFEQDSSGMAFDLQEENYASLIQSRHINEINGNTKPEAYHMLADYVQAAFMYRIYDAKKYADRAALMQSVMDESRDGMGELEVFADKVDKMIFGD